MNPTVVQQPDGDGVIYDPGAGPIPTVPFDDPGVLVVEQPADDGSMGDHTGPQVDPGALHDPGVLVNPTIIDAPDLDLGAQMFEQ